MNDMLIYTSLLSANGRKVQAVCRQLGVEAKIVDINVYAGDGSSEDYLKINPLGKIPALTDSKIVLTESNAIIVYLSENYGGQFLYGNDVYERTEINKWLFWESSQWQPFLSKLLEQHVGHKLLPSIVPAPIKEVDWEVDESVLQLSYLNSCLSGKNYLVGDKLSLADFSVAAMTTYFDIADFPYGHYENIARWLKKISHTEAWELTTHEMWKTEKT